MSRQAACKTLCSDRRDVLSKGIKAPLGDPIARRPAHTVHQDHASRPCHGLSSFRKCACSDVLHACSRQQDTFAGWCARRHPSSVANATAAARLVRPQLAVAGQGVVDVRLAVAQPLRDVRLAAAAAPGRLRGGACICRRVRSTTGDQGQQGKHPVGSTPGLRDRP